MTVLAQKLFRHSLPRLSRFALRSSTNPYALPRVRFFFVSLWRATQIGIRCLEMWIFCLFLFNTFVFVKLYRLLPDLQKHIFCTVSFSARHKEACPARGQSSSRCAAALRSSTNPYALPRVRFFFVSLWRATQIGIRCLEMWIFCLFLFNTFVFVKLYRLLPDLQKHLLLHCFLFGAP